MAADTTLTLYGLWHLAGATVAVVVAGVHMGNYIVATDGSVTVSYGADTDGVVTPAYLVSMSGQVDCDQNQTFDVFDGSILYSVTVPILVGLPYTATGQLLPPSTQEVLHSDNGPAIGKLYRPNHVALQVDGAHAHDMTVAVGMNPDTATYTAVSITTDGGITRELASTADQPYSGVLVVTFGENPPDFNGSLIWRSSLPYRCVVSLVSMFMLVSDR